MTPSVTTYGIEKDVLKNIAKSIMEIVKAFCKTDKDKDPTSAIIYDLCVTNPDVVATIIITTITYTLANKDRIPVKELEGKLKDGGVIDPETIKEVSKQVRSYVS